LAGYRLYRVLTVGGTPIGGVSIVGTIAAGTETFTDPTLFAANAYEYKIAAFDKAGNQSALSAAASVTTTVLLTAVTVNNGQIDVSWAATGGADHYELSRKTTGAWSTVGGEISATSYSDTSVSSSTAYFYRVRAMNSQDEPISLYSNTDIALTVSFTDDPLTVGVTPAKATHFTELRQAIDLARVAAGLGNASWSSLSSGSTITAAHLTELRSNLNAAFGILGVLTPAYTDPTLTAGTTTIKRAHIAELRTALR
jgi:hypothetical protein